MVINVRNAQSVGLGITEVNVIDREPVELPRCFGKDYDSRIANLQEGEAFYPCEKCDIMTLCRALCRPVEKVICKHEHLLPYHDDSILCLDCNEIIWQDHAKDYPAELKARFTTRKAKVKQ